MAKKLKVGDVVETKGATSGLWFPGELRSMDGDEYTVASRGWDNPVVVGPDRIRAFTPNDEVTIRKGGSIWASVAPDGTIRIGGSIVGSFDEDTTVRVGGSEAGYIAWNGNIWRGQTHVGAATPQGGLERNGSEVGSLDPSDGTIRLGGSIWGSFEPANSKFRSTRATVAVLVFFAKEFGY